MAHSNGIAREFDYHSLLDDKRLQKITNRTGTAASDIVSTFDYTYNAVGNIKEWGVRNDQGARNAWTLDYNPADELTDALLESPTSAVIEDLAWRFDRAGNRRLARDGSTWTGYGVNEVNELTEISDGNAHAPISGQLDEPAIVSVQGVRANVKPVDGGNYQFEAPLNVEPDSNGEFTVRAEDASGNVVESTFAAPAGSFSTPRSFVYDDNGNLTNDGVRVYVYDAANRLIGIDHTDGSTTDIEYDAFNRRDRIIETDATATVMSDKRYIWNGLTLLEERDTATDTALRRFCGTGEKWLTGTDAGNYFYFRDHLGSVRELIDNTGVIRTRYDYSLWGERTQISGDLDTESGYTGHWYHDSSGLHLAPFRAYNAELGRWLNRDPIQEYGGWNLYAYVSNEPTRFVDFLGLSQDSYVPDYDHHGGAHVDRYRNGKNIGRYRPDGSPMKHKKITPPKIPKSDLKKFEKAAAKCRQRAARLKDAARHTTGDEALQVIAIMEGASSVSSSDSSSSSSGSSTSPPSSEGGTIQFRGQTYRSEGGNLIPVN